MFNQTAAKKQMQSKYRTKNCIKYEEIMIYTAMEPAEMWWFT
jgi:hypothetical protein